MKRLTSIILVLGGIFLVLGCGNSIKRMGESEGITYTYEDVKDKLIRFHVLANSNSDEDQELKLKVKDEVIKYMEPILKESKDLEMSRKLLKENEEEIMEIAKAIIKSEGYNYDVKIELKKENFPEKIYGDIILPQGEYEAFRILIGDYKGENWWCVMFPPLCFTDVTKGEVAYEETRERMESTLGEAVEVEEIEEVKLKLKFLEVLKEMF